MAKKKATKKKVTKKRPTKKKSAKKKAGGVSKSQAIRDQIGKMPNASANKIAEAASKQVGEEVSAGLVYQVRTSMDAKKKGGKKKPGRRPAASADGGMNAKLIKEAAALLSHAGDAKAAREALSVAEDVSKIVKK